MFKRINITLPEELIKKIDEAATATYSTRSEIIKSAFMNSNLSKVNLPPENTLNTHPILTVIQPQDNTLVPTAPDIQHQIDVTTAIVEDTPELKPMCSMPFCKQRSEGHYRVITDGGENEKEYYLCVFHWNKSRKEGEVREI